MPTLASAFLPRTTSEVLAYLVTLSHADLASPLRLTSDGAAIISRGHVYQPRGMQLSVPHQRPGEVPRAKIAISDVDGALLVVLSSLSPSMLAVMIESVFVSAPDMPVISVRGIVVAGPHHAGGVTTLDVAGARTDGELYPARFFNMEWRGLH